MSNYQRPGGSPFLWVAILLGLSAIIGILVAMLSGGGLGSSAPPDWTPPPPTATPQRPTASPIVEVSSLPAAPAASSETTEVVLATPTTAATATPVRVTATRTRPVAPLRPVATVQPLQATPTPGLVVQVTATAQPAPGAESSPVAGATAAVSPTVAASPTPAATNTPAPTATSVPAATATAVAATPPPPTPLPPTPTPLPALSPPQLVSPAPNASASGEVEFTWAPTGELPSGTGYEVVVWNPGEDPAAARGVAPPTIGTALRANLDGMSQAGLFSGPQLNWTVLIVSTAPYQRFTQPAASPSHTLNYQTGGGGSPEAPPPPPKP